MKIGLIDVDSHNFPNLALMKISAYHKQLGDDVEFVSYYSNYDCVYISKVFTFTPDIYEYIPSDKVIYGGTGYNANVNLANEIENMTPDYSLYTKYNYAVGFLTRGCSRGCEFCIVNHKEGSSHKVANLKDFWIGQKEIKLLDPNLLECYEHLELLTELRDSKAYVDFTQGIDIRLINNYNLNILRDIKIKRIHFAYDQIKDKHIVEKSLIDYKNKTGANRNTVTVYILVNFNTTVKQDIERINFVRSINFSPYVMIYNKHMLQQGSIYFKMQRWANSPQICFTTEFSNYRG